MRNRTFSMRCAMVFVAAGMGLATLSSARGSILVDDWSVPETLASNFDFSRTPYHGSMLGGQRVLYIQNLSSGTTDASVSGGRFNLTGTPDAVPDITAVWDGGVSQTGLGGIDATEGGADNCVRLYYNDVNGDASLTMYLATDASDRSQANVFITPGSGYLDIPFSNFTNVGTSPANFQHIGSIYFDLQVGYPAGNPIDFQMGDISITNTAAPVPEPSSLALLGLGGLFLRRRR